MPLLGKGVEYALHCLTFLVHAPGESVSVSDIAEFQGVSPTYLAKIFGRLKRSGIVTSSRGLRGGFALARSPEQITFWDVAVAVEGKPALFRCDDIRENCILYQSADCKPEWLVGEMCAIHRTMMAAERQLEMFLRTQNLAWLAQTLSKKVPPLEVERGIEWFRNASSRRR